MIKIRKGVFETNSSSVHSIAIPSSDEINSKPGHISFGIGEFGWEIEEVDCADYFYTAMLTYFYKDDENINRWKGILEEELARYRITCDFAEPDYRFWTDDEGKEHKYLESGYIDHSEGLGDFFEYFEDNRSKIVPYLLRGRTFTGNDNIDSSEEGSNDRDQKKVEVWNYYKGKCTSKIVENPYYEEGNENYIWLSKGN